VAKLGACIAGISCTEQRRTCGTRGLRPAMRLVLAHTLFCTCCVQSSRRTIHVASILFHTGCIFSAAQQHHIAAQISLRIGSIVLS